MSGLSSRTIQRIENGQPASAESLKSLASVFEIDFTTLTSEPDMSATATATATATAATQAQQAEQLALARVRKIRGFYIHLAQYVVVITVLAVINLVTHPSKLWFFWPALGWGIGVLAHAAATFEFIPFFGAEWERKQVEKQLGRPL